MLITKIRLNQNKIVIKDFVFLAESDVYFNDMANETSEVYFKTPKIITIKAQTPHDVALQTIEVGDEEE